MQRQAQIKHTTKVFELTEHGESRINENIAIAFYKHIVQLCTDFLLLHPVQILVAFFFCVNLYLDRV